AQEGLDRLFKRLKFDYRKPDFREKVVSYLPTALRKGKDDFVDTFLVLYPAFATTRKVLELITNMVIDILFFLIHWLEKLPEDFRMAPDRVILKKLVDYLYQHLSLKFFQQRFQMLMSQLEAQDSTKTLEVEKKARDCGIRRATTSLAPTPDAKKMQKKLHPTPPSVAGPRRDLTPKKDTKNVDLAIGGPTLPEDGPEQPKHTSADSGDVIIHISAAGHIPAVVPVFPLPDIDM
ncbi:Ral guanine nucleotide dissociation stimulator, partial [Lemmus lemmus]